MFSIVIPLYNKEQSIKNTIQSVLNQSFQEFEILVINDGSTDESVKRVEELYDFRIRVVTKNNGGVSSARNIGIREAKYKWVAFLDGDDLWDRNYLLEVKQLIEDYPEGVIYGSNYYIQEKEKIEVQTNALASNFRGEILNYYKVALKGLLYWTSATVINREKTKGVLFDERLSLGEDLDFWFRIIQEGSAIYNNTPLSIYNNDGPNRAMNKKHDITKNFIFYSDKYSNLERSNKDFKKLINQTRIGKVPEVFLGSNATKSQINHFLSLIDYSGQSKRHLIFSLCPFFVKKALVTFKYKKEYK